MLNRGYPLQVPPVWDFIFPITRCFFIKIYIEEVHILYIRHVNWKGAESFCFVYSSYQNGGFHIFFHVLLSYWTYLTYRTYFTYFAYNVSCSCLYLTIPVQNIIYLTTTMTAFNHHKMRQHVTKISHMINLFQLHRFCMHLLFSAMHPWISLLFYGNQAAMPHPCCNLFKFLCLTYDCHQDLLLTHNNIDHMERAGGGVSCVRWQHVCFVALLAFPCGFDTCVLGMTVPWRPEATGLQIFTLCLRNLCFCNNGNYICSIPKLHSLLGC